MDNPFEITNLKKLPSWRQNTKDLISDYEKDIKNSFSYCQKYNETLESWHNDMKRSIEIINLLIDSVDCDDGTENNNRELNIQELHKISAKLPGGPQHEAGLKWLFLALTIILIGVTYVIPLLAFAIFFGVMAAICALSFFGILLDVRVGYSRSLYRIAKDLTEEFSFQSNLKKISNNSDMHNFIITLRQSSGLELTESALWLERATYKKNNQTHVLGLIRTFFNPKRVFETPATTQQRKNVDEAFHRISA